VRRPAHKKITDSERGMKAAKAKSYAGRGDSARLHWPDAPCLHGSSLVALDLVPAGVEPYPPAELRRVPFGPQEVRHPASVST
jgi:hypothetical protein